MKDTQEKIEKFLRNAKLLLAQQVWEGGWLPDYLIRVMRAKIFPLLSEEQIEKWLEEFPVFDPLLQILLNLSENVESFLKYLDRSSEKTLNPHQLKYWRFIKGFLDPLVGTVEPLSSKLIGYFNDFFTEEVISELKQIIKAKEAKLKSREMRVLEIPKFSLSSSRGERTNISDFKNRKNVVICILRSYPAPPEVDYISKFAQNYRVFEEAEVEIFPIIISNAENAKDYESRYAKNKFPVYFEEEIKVIDRLQLEEAIYGIKPSIFPDGPDDILESFSTRTIRLYRIEALAIVVIDKAGVVQYVYYSNSNHRIKLEANGRYSTRTINFSNVWQDLLRLIGTLKEYKPPQNYWLTNRLKAPLVIPSKNPFEKLEKVFDSSIYSRINRIPEPEQLKDLIEQAQKSNASANDVKTIELCESVLRLDSRNKAAWTLLEEIYTEGNYQKICGVCRSYKIGVCETRQQPIAFLDQKAKTCFYFLLNPTFVRKE